MCVSTTESWFPLKHKADTNLLENYEIHLCLQHRISKLYACVLGWTVFVWTNLKIASGFFRLKKFKNGSSFLTCKMAINVLQKSSRQAGSKLAIFENRIFQFCSTLMCMWVSLFVCVGTNSIINSDLQCFAETPMQ
jgi:hypothetical protein